MKALIIIAACLALALVFRAADLLSNRRKIKSVGAKSNKASRDIPKININDEAELLGALEYYKDMVD